jgi:hypothetical protein
MHRRWVAGGTHHTYTRSHHFTYAFIILRHKGLYPGVEEPRFDRPQPRDDRLLQVGVCCKPFDRQALLTEHKELEISRRIMSLGRVVQNILSGEPLAVTIHKSGWRCEYQ